MTRYAVIENGIVVNVILRDGESVYPADDLVPLTNDETVGIGWTLDGDEWVAPEPEPLPEPTIDPNLAQKLAAAQKLMDDFGFTEEMARAVVGLA